jgi:class 3 adenylate cyclase
MPASSDSAKSTLFRWRSSQKPILACLLVIGFVVGVSYRAYVDEAASRSLENYLRSGFHGFGVALTGWAVQEWFARNARSSLGAPMLLSVVLGTYHRPARRQLIVMFLDIAGSTRLAEEMGELRVHDLITRFFFDIDEPISVNGGAVHAYVGDEVIVTWPLTQDRARNARCLNCFFGIETKMAGLSAEYERAFKTTPMFRAGLHCGPSLSANAATQSGNWLFSAIR